MVTWKLRVFPHPNPRVPTIAPSTWETPENPGSRSLNQILALDHGLNLLDFIGSRGSISIQFNSMLHVPKCCSIRKKNNVITSGVQNCTKSAALLKDHSIPVGTGPFKQHLFNIVCQCFLTINFGSYLWTLFVYTFSTTMFKQCKKGSTSMSKKCLYKISPQDLDNF